MDEDWSSDSGGEADRLEEEVRLYSLVHHSATTFEEPPSAAPEPPPVADGFNHSARTKVNRLGDVHHIIHASNLELGIRPGPDEIYPDDGDITNRKSRKGASVGQMRGSNAKESADPVDSNSKTDPSNNAGGRKPVAFYFDSPRKELSNIRNRDAARNAAVACKANVPSFSTNASLELHRAAGTAVTPLASDLSAPGTNRQHLNAFPKTVSVGGNTSTGVAKRVLSEMPAVRGLQADALRSKKAIGMEINPPEPTLQTNSVRRPEDCQFVVYNNVGTESANNSFRSPSPTTTKSQLLDSDSVQNGRGNSRRRDVPSSAAPHNRGGGVRVTSHQERSAAEPGASGPAAGRTTEQVPFTFNLSAHGIFPSAVPSPPNVPCPSATLFPRFNVDRLQSGPAAGDAFRLDVNLFAAAVATVDDDIRNLERNLLANMTPFENADIRQLEGCLIRSIPVGADRNGEPLSSRPRAKSRLGPKRNDSVPKPSCPPRVGAKAKDRLGPPTNAGVAELSAVLASPKVRRKARDRLGLVVDDVTTAQHESPRVHSTAKDRLGPMPNATVATDRRAKSPKVLRASVRDRLGPLHCENSLSNHIVLPPQILLPVPTFQPSSTYQLPSLFNNVMPAIRPKAVDRLGPLTYTFLSSEFRVPSVFNVKDRTRPNADSVIPDQNVELPSVLRTRVKERLGPVTNAAASDEVPRNKLNADDPSRPFYGAIKSGLINFSTIQTEVNDEVVPDADCLTSDDRSKSLAVASERGNPEPSENAIAGQHRYDKSSKVRSKSVGPTSSAKDSNKKQQRIRSRKGLSELLESHVTDDFVREPSVIAPKPNDALKSSDIAGTTNVLNTVLKSNLGIESTIKDVESDFKGVESNIEDSDLNIVDSKSTIEGVESTIKDNESNTEDIVVLGEYVNLVDFNCDEIVLDSDSESGSDESVVVVSPPRRPDPVVIAVEDSGDDDESDSPEKKKPPLPPDDFLESSNDFLDPSCDVDRVASTQAAIMSRLISSHGSKESLLDERLFSVESTKPTEAVAAKPTKAQPNQDDNVSSSTVVSSNMRRRKRAKSPDIGKILDYIETYSKRAKGAVAGVESSDEGEARSVRAGKTVGGGFLKPQTPRQIRRRAAVEEASVGMRDLDTVDVEDSSVVAVHSGTKMDESLEETLDGAVVQPADHTQQPPAKKKKRKLVQPSDEDTVARRQRRDVKRLQRLNYGTAYTPVAGDDTVAVAPPLHPASWTAEMRQFYNKSWGGEGFSYRALQSSMSDDPRLWHSPTAAPASKRSRNNARCNCCHKSGHMAYDCPRGGQPKCHMCGELGHDHARCPRSVCLKCGQPNRRFVSDCWSCANSPHDSCRMCVWRHPPAEQCRQPFQRARSCYRPPPHARPSPAGRLNPAQRGQRSRSRWS